RLPKDSREDSAPPRPGRNRAKRPDAHRLPCPNASRSPLVAKLSFFAEIGCSRRQPTVVLLSYARKERSANEGKSAGASGGYGAGGRHAEHLDTRRCLGLRLFFSHRRRTRAENRKLEFRVPRPERWRRMFSPHGERLTNLERAWKRSDQPPDR